MPWKQPNPSLTNSSAYLEPRVSNVESSMADKTTLLRNIVIDITDKQFGAKLDGINDDAPALRSAVSYLSSIGGGKVFIPKGTALLKTYDSSIELNGYYICKLLDNITIEGTGELSVLKVDNNLINNITDGSSGVNVFLSNNRTNVHLKKFKVDCNGQNNLAPNGAIRTFYGANFNSGSNCSVEDTHWENNSGRNVILFGGFSLQMPYRSGAIIRNNIIHNFGSGVTGNIYQNDSSSIFTSWDSSVVEGNIITNDNEPTNGRGGIEVHGNNSIAIDNYMKYCYPGIYLSSDWFTWTASKAYVVGDTIIPTRGKFVGRQYKCTTAGTSGATEPTYGATTTTDNTVTWTDNGLAQIVNQVIERNTFDKCHGGVFIWNGGGDYNSSRIINNKIGLKQSSALSGSIIAGINQVQGNDAGGLTIPVNLNLIIEDNEIFQDAPISTTSTQTTSGITVYSGDSIRINRNLIHDLDNTPITILGSSRYLKNVEINHNTIKNFQINNVTSAKAAIMFNLTGSTTTPSVSAFNSTNVYMKHNYITNDTLDSTAYGFYFAWGGSSVITNLAVSDNILNNLAGVKAGAQYLSVVVTPDTNYQSATGWVKEKNGLTTQWTRVTYTATAGTNQTFSFPTAFLTANCHVQLTPSNNSNAIASLISKTASQLTISCNVTSLDVYVYAVGN